MRLNINTDEAVVFTNKLEQLASHALPTAIRGTLNDTAFKMKTSTMPKKAKAMFEERQPNFFKANSRVEVATGMDIKTMASTVGFISSGLHNSSTNYAVKDLEQQEHAGIIKGRSFKPLAAARRGGTGNVRANARISQLLKAGNIIDARDSRTTGSGKNGKMQQFIKASVHAGVGGYVLGGSLLWKVTRLRRLGGGTTVFKKQKLYSFKKDGTAKVRARGFMRASALEVQKEMEFFYKLQANRQIRKALGK
jgi:hypothetical protein